MPRDSFLHLVITSHQIELDCRVLVQIMRDVGPDLGMLRSGLDLCISEEVTRSEPGGPGGGDNGQAIFWMAVLCVVRRPVSGIQSGLSVCPW